MWEKLKVQVKGRYGTKHPEPRPSVLTARVPVLQHRARTGLLDVLGLAPASAAGFSASPVTTGAVLTPPSVIIVVWLLPPKGELGEAAGGLLHFAIALPM